VVAILQPQGHAGLLLRAGLAALKVGWVAGGCVLVYIGVAALQ
jgi:hypothetical protein